MASKNGIRYFFLNGDLHKALKITRTLDLIEAWNYPKHERMIYSLSHVKKSMEKAFPLKTAAKMINRSVNSVYYYIADGRIRKPQYTYSLGSGKKLMNMFSESEILDMHEMLLDRHWGRPGVDDSVPKPKPLPSKAELRAMLEHSVTLMVRDSDGNIVPIWKEKGWL
jgi:hypothetical protein